MAYTGSDGFEVGDSNLTDGDGAYWTSGSFSSGTLVGNDVTVVKSGTYSAKFVTAVAGGSAWTYHNLSAAGDDEYFQVWMYVDSITADVNTRVCNIFTGRNAATARIVVRVNYQTASTFKMQMFVQLDGITATTTGATTYNVGQWYLIEARYVCHATTGGGQVWVNGVLEISDIDGDTDFALNQVNRWYLGGNTGYNFTAATIYYDDAKDHTAYIGGAALTVSVADSIAVAESVGMLMGGTEVHAIDTSSYVPSGYGGTISIGESVSLDIGPRMYDAGWISEVVTIIFSSALDVSSAIAIGEEVTLVLDSLNISVSDAATLAESITPYWQELDLSVNDSVSIAEAALVYAYQENQPNVYDAMAIGEAVTILLTELKIGVSDTIYAYDFMDTEGISFEAVKIGVSDQCHLTEQITLVVRPIIVSAAISQYLGSSHGEVFEYAGDHYSDDGTNILCTWESKLLDFGDLEPKLSEMWKVLRQVKLVYKDLDATAVILSASIDDGVTWSSKTANIGTGDGQIKEQNFHFWLTGKQFKFKIEHTSDSDRFQWVQMEVKFDPTSAYMDVTA